MDMAFLRRAERILEERESLRLDHQLLVAALAAQQETAVVTARARIVAMAPRLGLSEEDPLIELLLAGPRWREAIARQQGCFSRVEAGRRINGP